MDAGLACQDRCEPKVRRLLDVRDSSFSQPATLKKILGRSQSTYKRSGLLFLVMGAALLIWGVYYVPNGVTPVLGGIAVFYGLWQIYVSRPITETGQFRLSPKCGYNVTGNTTGECPECGCFV